MSKSVIVYTTNTCPYCTMVKNYLTDQGVSFKEINVQTNQTEAKKLIETTGQMGVPQIQIDDQWVLGYDPDAISQLLSS